MIPLVYFASLGVILVFTHGHYHEHLMWVLVGIHAVFGASVFCWKEQRISLPARAQLLAAVFFLFTVFLVNNPELIFVENEELYGTLKVVSISLSACAAGLLLATGLPNKWWNRILVWTLLLSSAALLIAAYILTVQCSPNPAIDVWTINQSAVEHVLAGENPYLQQYPDIYDGARSYAPRFGYMPGWLLWSVVLSLPFGKEFDVRISLIIAELVSACFLVLIARQLRYGWRGAFLCALVWLAFPIGLFVLEQAWIDSVLIAVFAGAVCAMLAGRHLLTGLLVGYAIGTKQYALIAAAFMLIFIYRTTGFKKAGRMALGTAISASVLLLPFAIADWQTFYELFVVRVSELVPLPSLNIPTFFALELPTADTEVLFRFFLPFTLVGWAIVVAVMGWALHKKTTFGPQRLFSAISLSYGVFFLTGKLAFCNYYYFLAFFLFLACMVGLCRPLVGPEGSKRIVEL